MHTQDSLTTLRFQAGAQHLHRLGADATAAFLTELAGAIGGQPVIMRLLAEYQNRPLRRPTPIRRVRKAA